MEKFNEPLGIPSQKIVNDDAPIYKSIMRFVEQFARGSVQTQHSVTGEIRLVHITVSTDIRLDPALERLLNLDECGECATIQTFLKNMSVFSDF